MRGILAAIVAGLIYLEWRQATVSTMVRRMLAQRRSTFIAILAFAALLGTFVFQPGSFFVADNRADVSIPWAVLQLVRQGNLPVIWTTYVHMGSPLMQLHNSLYYYVAAFLGWVLPNFFLVSKIMAFIIIVASAIAMYVYVVELTGSALTGCITTAAWCGSFYRYQLLALAGNGPLFSFTAFWPIQFYFIERALKSSRAFDIRRLGLVALAVGVQVWLHTYHGTWIIPLGLLYSGVRVWAEASTSLPIKSRQFLGLVGAHAAGILMGAYLIVPEVLESHLVPGPLPASGLGIESILSPEHTWLGGFIGYSIVVLAVLGFVLVIVARYRTGFAIAAQAALLSLVVFVPHYIPTVNDILNHIPFGTLVYFKGTGRYLTVLFGPITVLAGMGVQLSVSWLRSLPGLARWSQKKWALAYTRVALASIALILAENVPLTIKFNYNTPDTYLIDTPGRWPLAAALSATDDKTARVLDMGEGVNPSFLYPMLTGHTSLGGNYEEAPDSFATSKRLWTALSADLKTNTISSTDFELLYQLNIGYFVTDGVNQKLNGLELIQRSDSASLWRVPFHSPITATATPSSSFGVKVSVPQGGDVPVILAKLNETAATVTMDFSVPKKAFIQVAYSSYPYQQVVLDGQSIKAVETPLGFIGFWAEPGRHSLQILPELSPWRKITLPISLGTIIVVVGAGLWPFMPGRIGHTRE